MKQHDQSVTWEWPSLLARKTAHGDSSSSRLDNSYHGNPVLARPPIPAACLTTRACNVFYKFKSSFGFFKAVDCCRCRGCFCSCRRFSFLLFSISFAFFPASKPSCTLARCPPRSCPIALQNLPIPSHLPLDICRPLCPYPLRLHISTFPRFHVSTFPHFHISTFHLSAFPHFHFSTLPLFHFSHFHLIPPPPPLPHSYSARISPFSVQNETFLYLYTCVLQCNLLEQQQHVIRRKMHMQSHLLPFMALPASSSQAKHAHCTIAAPSIILLSNFPLLGDNNGLSLPPLAHRNKKIKQIRK